MAAMNGEDQNPLVEINGVVVRLQDGRVALRHHDCPDAEETAVMRVLVRDPDDDENYADAVDELFKCYVCERPINAIWRRLWAC